MQFQFFEWESIGTPERSWWVYFMDEVPKLATMGVTIAWLPRKCATPGDVQGFSHHQSAPNRAMSKVGAAK